MFTLLFSVQLKWISFLDELLVQIKFELIYKRNILLHLRCSEKYKYLCKASGKEIFGNGLYKIRGRH